MAETDAAPIVHIYDAEGRLFSFKPFERAALAPRLAASQFCNAQNSRTPHCVERVLSKLAVDVDRYTFLFSAGTCLNVRLNPWLYIQ